MPWPPPPALDWEPLLRLGVFSLLAILFWSAEWLAPRRLDGPARFPRQLVNLALVGLNTLVLRLAVPLMAVDAAGIAVTRQWGLINWLEWSGAAAVVLTLLLMDLAIYWQHRLFHRWPLLWRFHRMHHSDPFFDVTTGVRFHPVEIVASMGIKIGLVIVLGAPVIAVVLFEVILNGTSLFNHANLKLPDTLDRWLRRVVVTPDMHRVHHSVLSAEHNRNFGFNLSVWDRLFGSYRDQPVNGHLGMAIGLTRFASASEQSLPRLLAQPWSGRTAD